MNIQVLQINTIHKSQELNGNKLFVISLQILY